MIITRKLGHRCASLACITWISCIICITCITCTKEISHQLISWDIIDIIIIDYNWLLLPQGHFASTFVKIVDILPQFFLHIFLAYFGHILDISWAYLGQILGISWAYLRRISGISRAYFGHILGMSWTYFGHILGMSWTYFGHILGISWTYIIKHYWTLPNTIELFETRLNTIAGVSICPENLISSWPCFSQVFFSCPFLKNENFGW